MCQDGYGFIKSLMLLDISSKAQILWKSNYVMISTFILKQYNCPAALPGCREKLENVSQVYSRDSKPAGK